MKKKIILGLVAAVVVVGGVASMSAWEAHVINVTAHIENALLVMPRTGELEFGTVFPQEYLEKPMWITTSDSFCETDQRRVLTIDYKIVQKPKCECILWDGDNTPTGECLEGQYVPIDYATHLCLDGYEEMSSLCPYLSKTIIDDDPVPFDDQGVLAFHDPEDPTSVAYGTIDKDEDKQDAWLIDLVVPCFEGMCGQDWDEFVAQYNSGVDPRDYELPAELESSDFGCDLWVEVVDVYNASAN